MLDCLKPRINKIKQQEIIAAYGQPFQGIGIIASGKVALTKETYSGNRIMIGILDAGDIFGEIVAFSDSKVWPMTVIAQEDGILLFLPPEKITGTCSNICASHSALIMNMLKILSNRASMLDKKIEHISAKNIRGKISSYLLDISQNQNSNTITIPMKRHEMADYLNIPRPSLSREMGLMRDQGVIEFEGSFINIKDISVLEKSIR
ncbi:MAG: Crp/Fnr family transcriptional regulator [Dehalococcoidales bacterium]|nr:Crp/Fnr family transcriptional regulator [Dehalococcoidales bacterium]